MVLGGKDTLDSQLLESEYLLSQPVWLDSQASNV